MDTAALMKQLMIQLDGVADPVIAREIILPILKEYGEGIPDEVLDGMAEALFLEILKTRSKATEPATEIIETEITETVSQEISKDQIIVPPKNEIVVQPKNVSSSAPITFPSRPVAVREHFSLQSLSEESLPLWVIDWGSSQPISGALLSPKFMILAPEFHSKPWVLIELDERLLCPYWNRTPVLNLESDGVWSFYEQLNIPADEAHLASREYLLRIRVVFHEDGGCRIFCFQGTIRIKTPDITQTQRTLEISGDGASLINLSSADLAEFHRVKITGGDQTLVNVQSGWVPPAEASPVTPRHHLVEIRLRPDLATYRIVPRQSGIQTEPYRSNQICLISKEKEYKIFLFAKPNLLLGRSAEETLTEDACDIVTRIYHPKMEQVEYYDEDLVQSSRFLSRLFSRNHCELEITPRGLRITDRNSALGTFAGGQLLSDSPMMIEWKLLTRSISIILSGILELSVKSYCDPTWQRLVSLGNVSDTDLEEFYTQAVFGSSLSFHAQGMSGLWKLAASQADCDAILFSRQKSLVTDRNRPHIAERIGKQTKQPESILAQLDHAIRFCRHDPFAKSCEYLLLLRSATIGSSRDDAICLSDSGLGDGFARILYINNTFWIEPLQNGYHRVMIGDQPLDCHELYPLIPDQSITFGEQEFFVTK